MTVPGLPVSQAFMARFQGVLDQINANTDLFITDFMTVPWYFTSATLQWHNDPPPFYFFQTSITS